MKIRPLEKNDDKIVKLKIFLLFFFIIIGLIFSYFYKEPIRKNNKINTSILGENTRKQIFTKKNIENIVTKATSNSTWLANQAKEEILGESAFFINQIASSAGNAVSSFIYDTTLKPIVDQFQRLPKNQQEKVKQQICK